MKLRARFIASAFALVAVAGALVATPTAAHAATIANDTVAKVVTMSGSRYIATLEYGLQARISSLKIDGREVLDPAQGIYSALKPAGAAWTTSQTLAASPTVAVTGSTVSLSFSTALASEVWTFTVQDAQLVFGLSRTYASGITLAEQGSPMLNFAESSFDAMHWPGDGGSWPLGGNLLNVNQSSWLATGPNLNPSVRAAKEQIAYTLLNRPTSTALSVSATSNRSGVDRGQATEIRRSTNNDLRFQVMVSATTLAYSSGSVKGYSGGSGNGHVRVDGVPVFNATAVTAGQNDVVTTTFAPRDFDAEYDLGTLNGVDEELVAQVLDYALWAIQDTKRGASTEASILKAEVPALEMHHIGQLLEISPDPAAIAAFQRGLEDIRDDLTNPVTGEVRCCRPGTGVYWGANYGDQVPGYTLGIVAAYELSGDTAWLTSMAASVRAGLGFQHSSRVDATGLVTNHAQATSGVWENNYWQESVGTYDGYSSALYYEALTKWAQLESQVLGNPANAATYTTRATTLKTQFNKDVANGGLWSPATNTFLYGSGNNDALFLPVNAQVLKTDIATRARKLLIVQAIEAQDRAGQYDFHPLNVRDIWANQPAPNGHPQNGGWYAAPDGEFSAGLPLRNDPQRMQDYITAFLSRYQDDGFYGASGWARNDWLSGSGEKWFPTQAMPIWGLYHSMYGFQPEYDRLVLAPHIAPGMTASTVKYTWRGNDLSVTYNSQRSFTVAAPVMATNIVIRWTNQTPGAIVHNRVDGGNVYALTVNADGVAEGLFNKANAGVHTFDCYDCTVPSAGTSAGISAGTSFVTSVAQNGTTVRNDTTQYVGFKVVVGGTDVVVRSLGRYKLPGNSQMHLLKIVDSAGQTVATTSVDMSQAADGSGFVWAALPQQVTLTHGQTYYVYSLEAKGGDTWWDSGATVGHTAVASVPSAAYGRSLTGNQGTNHSYGPVNFKY